MKKTIFLVLILFLISGCTVEYDLYINGNEFNENFKIIETNTSLFDKSISESYTMRQYFNRLVEPDFYSYDDSKRKLIDKDNELGISYKKKTQNFSTSDIFNQCYNDSRITKNDKTVIIDTGDDFSCYNYYDNIESIKVTIKTNNKVLTNNADMIDGKKYIWNITESGNKRIIFSYIEKEKVNIPYWPFVLIISLIVIFILYRYFKVKIQNSNNI